jgi:WD40 repeat protein
MDNETTAYPDFSRKKNTLLVLLLIYCAALFVCRFVGLGEARQFLSLIDRLTFGETVMLLPVHPLVGMIPLRMLPYYLMPVVGLLWLRLKPNRTSLFFVGGMSWAGGVNHVCAFLPFLYYNLFSVRGFMLPRPQVVIALALAGGFALLSRRMFRLAKLLYSREGEAKGRYSSVIALLALAFCFLSPLLKYGEIVKSMTRARDSYENVTLLKPGVHVNFMDGSPDGKLLAVGATDGLSVWDAESRECVWSDDSVAAQRVRFSPSGKYLAAAGRGVPDGSSDLAVYEVDGFRRLPGFNWPEEDLRKEKIFHDLAFRSDEKSLLAAWHRERDWDQMTREEEIAVRRKENEEQAKMLMLPAGTTVHRKQYLVCTEWGMGGETYGARTLRELSVYYDLFPDGGIYFSPDASYLLYPQYYSRNNSAERRRVYLVDTSDWTEEEIWLDSKYSMSIESAAWWYEWKFTRDKKTAYLLAEGDGFVLLEMDMTTKQTKELREVQVKQFPRLPPWQRIVLSPDEKRLGLLGRGEALYDYKGTQNGGKMVTLHILDLETGKTNKFAYKHDGRYRSGSWRAIWLPRGTLAVSMRERNGFFFAKIEQEN